MKDLQLIEEALTEQKQEIQRYLQRATCNRSEETLVNFESEMAQVVIGVRRSGKSTLCRNVLRDTKKTFAYVNFDDERLALLSGDDLNEVLRLLYNIYGDFECLFIDEIQNIPEWYLFVNRLLRQGMHILITGSNAKLLSGELATHLTGRHSQIELFPFSFRECCAYNKVDTATRTTQADALRHAAFDEYLKSGGFPEIVKRSASLSYIDDLMQSIIYRDIRTRYNIKYMAAFSRLAAHLLNVCPVKVNVKELQELFHIGSYQTMENYLDYLKQAYLIIGVHKYSAKSRMRIRDEKLYAVDPALMSNRQDAFSGENLGWRLETLVLLELLRRHRPYRRDVYYYDETAGEADFLVCKGNQTLEIIQVSYDINNPKTRKRELKGLDLAARATGCKNLTLITNYHQEIEVTEKGLPVRSVSVVDWLLEDA
jgi:predicted AAA+ superfamily ATPase